MSTRNLSQKTNERICFSISEILETWNPNSSFKYFRVVRIEKQIRSFIFWEKFLARQFCFEIYWPLKCSFCKEDQELFSAEHFCSSKNSWIYCNVLYVSTCHNWVIYYFLCSIWPYLDDGHVQLKKFQLILTKRCL
jgi:hypothetical protein